MSKSENIKTAFEAVGTDVKTLYDLAEYAPLPVGAGNEGDSLDGLLYINESSAQQGLNGKGFTNAYYEPSTGKIIFQSDDGLGFETEDLRGPPGEHTIGEKGYEDFDYTLAPGQQLMVIFDNFTGRFNIAKQSTGELILGHFVHVAEGLILDAGSTIDLFNYDDNADPEVKVIKPANSSILTITNQTAADYRIVGRFTGKIISMNTV